MGSAKWPSHISRFGIFKLHELVDNETMRIIPHTGSLEIHITYRCNLHCAHCHNLVGPAPSNEDMPLSWLAKMLFDSLQLKHQWGWLVLHGGEPCLHPQAEEVYRMLAHYKKTANSSVMLKITTNGHGPHNKAAMELAASYGFDICDSKKTGIALVDWHSAVLSSPKDCGEQWYEGCYQSSECGICYTNRGFYECSPAGAAWRVMGYPPLCTELKDVTPELLAEGFKVHCQHCGYARFPDRNFSHNPDAPMSKTWIEAIEKYNQNQHDT